MMASRILSTARPLSRTLRPLLSSTSRTFALDSKSTASASAPGKTGQSPAGGLNNQQAGASTGINATQNPQKQTSAHSMGSSQGPNTGDRPPQTAPMSDTGTGHDQTQSMGSYARQADKAGKDGGKASHQLHPKTAVAGTPNATSGNETMSGGSAKANASSSSSSSSSSMAGQSKSSPAGKSESTVGSGGAIGTQGSPTVGGGSHRTTTGEKGSAGGGLAPGGVAGMTEKAKEKIHELTGDVTLPPASSYTVVLATMLAVPLLFWLDPDYRWLKNEAAEQEKRIYEKYHGIK